MFFLTAVDTEHLNIRGSRDPLGLVPLWGTFGRKVVGNLTTASDSVRGFTTLLIGLHFADRVSAGKPDREQVRLAAFLKFEQMAGFARVLRNKDGSMRGITQIRRRLERDARRIRIGAAQDLQILSNQKTYGLWGLFTVPAIDSGLVVQKELRLTPEAKEFVETQYLSVLDARDRHMARTLEEILSRPFHDLEPNGKHGKLFDALGAIHSPKLSPVERAFYHSHLILGGPKAERTGWQPRFAELLESTLPATGNFSHEDLRRLIAAASSTTDAPIKSHLIRIRDLEALLTATTNLFGFLQHRSNGTVKAVTGELKTAWPKGLRHVRPEAISEMRGDLAHVYGDATAADRLVHLAEALHRAEYDAAIDHVLGHNAFVMATRNGSQPWVQRSGSHLEVRYADEAKTELLSSTELATRWQSGFYIDPLKTVSNELRRTGARG